VNVAGEAAKPVFGADGTRVPLLRPGFRPNGPYSVTFVYLHAGTPFAKKGEMQMTLPQMDMPVGIVEWEVFVPDTYSARAVDGNVIDREAIAHAIAGRSDNERARLSSDMAGGVGIPLRPGQIRGRVIDSTGMPIPGVTIELNTSGGHQIETTGVDGTYVLTVVPSGTVTVAAHLAGFKNETRTFTFDQRPRQLDFTLSVGAVAETVTVTAESPKVLKSMPRADDKNKDAEPSQNVIDLQRRTAGVLPIRVDVPRAGTSHQFVKPLVVDQATTVTFRYKRR